MKVILDNTLSRIGKTKYWLSKQTGIAGSTISNLCNGKTTRIDFSVLQTICDALNCTINDIIIADDEDEINNFILKDPQNKIISYLSHFDKLQDRTNDISLLVNKPDDSNSESLTELGRLLLYYALACQKCNPTCPDDNTIELPNKDDTE